MAEIEIVRALRSYNLITTRQEYIRLYQEKWDGIMKSCLMDTLGAKYSCPSSYVITEAEEKKQGEELLKNGLIQKFRPMFARNKNWKAQRIDVSSPDIPRLIFGSRKSYAEIEKQWEAFNEGVMKASISDEQTPISIFATTSNQLVKQIADGEIDAKQLAIHWLAEQGLDQDMKWVGFKKAKEIAQQRIESQIKVENMEQLAKDGIRKGLT